MTRRHAIRAILLGLALFAFHAQDAVAQKTGRAPKEVVRALKDDPRFAKGKIVSIFVRRPAPTEAGYMYEVVLRTRGKGETLVYVDPGTGRILFDTGPARR